MGVLFSKQKNEFETCKKQCWDTIQQELYNGLVIVPNFKFRLKNNREIMSLGCIKCNIKCPIDCMAIIILVSTKTKSLDLGYSVIAFKKYDYMIEYINQYYPDGTTKANEINTINPYPNNNPNYYKDKIIDQKHYINDELAVYQYIEQLYK
jgi:translation initiation factor RLI1